MSLTRTTGTQVAIASTYGTAANITAITNAAEAVATLATGHGATVGDYLEVTSGWSLLNGRIVRVKTVAGELVTLEGINTTDVNAYPTGAGLGSVRRITQWTPITQIKKDGGIASEGGDPKFAPASTMDDEDDKEIPDGRTAMKINITVFDDPSLSWYPIVKAASDSSVPAAMRLIYKNGSRTVANGYWSMPEMPQTQAILENTISFSASARVTRYAN